MRLSRFSKTLLACVPLAALLFGVLALTDEPDEDKKKAPARKTEANVKPEAKPDKNGESLAGADTKLQQAVGEAVSFFNDRIDGGSISMTGVRIG